jgi:hypothetical protein
MPRAPAKFESSVRISKPRALYSEITAWKIAFPVGPEMFSDVQGLGDSPVDRKVLRQLVLGTVIHG